MAETIGQTKPKKISTAEHKRPAKRKEIEAQLNQQLIKNGLFLQRELSQSCQ